jgi:dihydroorotase
MPDYDLIIFGGTVVDPSQDLNDRRDVAIGDGKVVAVEPRIERERAAELLDATGLLVTPGLVDVHVHVYPGVSHYGVEPDADVLTSGVTTALDAGSAGASTFDGLRRYVIDVSATRLLACLNISGLGMVSPDVGELEDIRWADPAAAVRVCERHRDVIVGIKIRLSRTLAGDNALPALRNAREAADAVGLPVMVHPQDAVIGMDQILRELQAGDLVTHCYHGRAGGVLDADGRVRASVRDAVQRGIRFDVGHGKGSFDFTVVERALAQDLPPHTISSDLHAYNIEGPVFDLATTLSKFLLLGLDLPEALRLCTVAPADFLGLSGQVGTLAPGAHADVALFREETGAHPFTDSEGQIRTGERRLVPVKVVKAGRVIEAVDRFGRHRH